MENDLEVKVGLSIISKKGISVWRNRVKRILRETLRKESRNLSAIAKEKESTLLIIFSPYTIDQNNSQKIKLSDLTNSVKEILIKLKSSPGKSRND